MTLVPRGVIGTGIEICEHIVGLILPAGVGSLKDFHVIKIERDVIGFPVYAVVMLRGAVDGLAIAIRRVSVLYICACKFVAGPVGADAKIDLRRPVPGELNVLQGISKAKPGTRSTATPISQ